MISKVIIISKSKICLQKMRTSSSNTINQWMNSPKIKLTSREKRPLRIKDLLSKNKESRSTMIRWHNQSKGTRKDLRPRRTSLLKPYKKECYAFSKKKRMLRPSMSKREKLLRTQRRAFNNHNLLMIEKRLYKLKSMKIWKDSKRI